MSLPRFLNAVRRRPEIRAGFAAAFNQGLSETRDHESLLLQPLHPRINASECYLPPATPGDVASNRYAIRLLRRWPHDRQQHHQLELPKVLAPTHHSYNIE